MNGSSSKPDPIAVAAMWVGRVLAFAMAMVLPLVAGRWLDDWLGTRFLAFVGLVLGFILGMYYLLAATGAVGRGRSKSTNGEDPPSRREREQ